MLQNGRTSCYKSDVTPASLQTHAFWTTVFAFVFAIISVAGLCCRGRRPALPHKWLSCEWLQKVCVGASSADPPYLRSILLPSDWARRKRFLTEAIIIVIPWGAETEAGVRAIPLPPECPPPPKSFIHFPPPRNLFAPPCRHPRSSWPWPSACSFPHPRVRKSLLPVSAGKLFCPPVPCFHYLV